MVNADAYINIGEKMKTNYVEVNGLNTLILNCVDIKIDTKQYAKDEMKELLKQRQSSLLNPQELRNKIEMEEAFCLKNGKSDSKIYVYIAQNSCEMSKVQFYNDNGLLFTYPWNGKYNIESRLDKENSQFKAVYEMTTDRSTSFCYWRGRKEIRHLQCGVTKSGKIAIDDLSVVERLGKKSTEWNLSVYNTEGKEQIVVNPNIFGVNSSDKNTSKCNVCVGGPIIAK